MISFRATAGARAVFCMAQARRCRRERLLAHVKTPCRSRAGLSRRREPRRVRGQLCVDRRRARRDQREARQPRRAERQGPCPPRSAGRQELLFAVRPVRMVYSPRPPRRARALALRPSLWWAEPCALDARAVPDAQAAHPPAALTRSSCESHAPRARVLSVLPVCFVLSFGLSSASPSARARRRPRRRPCRAASHSRSTRWCST